jgi:hypothetical protein
MFLARRLRITFTPKIKLIIFDQETCLHVLPIPYIGSTTFLCETPPQENTQDTFISKPSFCGAVPFVKPNFFLY